jgi:hypothetical protein
MRYHSIALAACFALGCTSRPEPMPFELSPAEVRQARDLAESLEPFADLRHPSPATRIVFVKAERLPGPDATSSARDVMLQHYRYRDDATIFTHVDLNRHEVVKCETSPHYPTGLAEEEVSRAKELAKNDDRLRTMIEAQGLSLIPRPLEVNDAANPLQHHRVVQLLLQRGRESLLEPKVLVDLTQERVIIGE